MPELLLAGQVHDSATPNAVAAELYVLSEGFGQPIGTDTPLLVETDDIAPAGPLGWTLLRRIVVPVRYRASCTVRVTPIIDYQTILPSVSKTFAAPSEESVGEVECPAAHRCRWVRTRIEVTSRNGLVEVMTPRLMDRPILESHPATAGAQI